MKSRNTYHATNSHFDARLRAAFAVVIMHPIFDDVCKRRISERFDIVMISGFEMAMHVMTGRWSYGGVTVDIIITATVFAYTCVQ